MSQLIEYRLFDEQTMSRVVSANGKSTYSMSPRGPSPRSRGHLFNGLLLHIQFFRLAFRLTDKFCLIFTLYSITDAYAYQLPGIGLLATIVLAYVR